MITIQSKLTDVDIMITNSLVLYDVFLTYL